MSQAESSSHQRNCIENGKSIRGQRERTISKENKGLFCAVSISFGVKGPDNLMYSYPHWHWFLIRKFQINCFKGSFLGGPEPQLILVCCHGAGDIIFDFYFFLLTLPVIFCFIRSVGLIISKFVHLLDVSPAFYYLSANNLGDHSWKLVVTFYYFRITQPEDEFIMRPWHINGFL